MWFLLLSPHEEGEGITITPLRLSGPATLLYLILRHLFHLKVLHKVAIHNILVLLKEDLDVDPNSTMF